MRPMPTTPGDEPELAAMDRALQDAPQRTQANGAFAVVRTVLDPYSVRILMATHEAECTAFDLSRRFGIPIVACYRRLRELEDLGIIAPSRVRMSTAGHPIRLFRSHLRSARINFEDGRLTATIELAPPESEAPAESRLEEAIDDGPVRRKRSRAPRNFGDRGAALEVVAHGREGSLDAGEAGSEVGE